MRFVIALILFSNPAWAECANNERTFLSCQFENGKAVEVCMSGEVASYRFGRAGQTPELALSLRFGEGAEAVPWPGVGSSIWEAVRLTNNDVIYEVYGGFDRFKALEEGVVAHFGGIYIEDANGNELAHLECIPETVDFVF